MTVAILLFTEIKQPNTTLTIYTLVNGIHHTAADAVCWHTTTRQIYQYVPTSNHTYTFATIIIYNLQNQQDVNTNSTEYNVQVFNSF